MDLACDKHTGEIIDAVQLWLISSVDPLGYECRGCGVPVVPCSYRHENKVRPYFRVKEAHKADCNVDGEIELVKRAQKQSVQTSEGIPGGFPDRLILQDSRPVVDQNVGSPTTSSRGECRSNSNEGRRVHRNARWAAKTIRPICRTFINFPFDRNLPLAVPDVPANTFQHVFRSLKRDQIITYPELHIFNAPIYWKRPIIDEEKFEILLSYGEWKEQKLIQPYQVRIDWRDWSKVKRDYVVKEIETAISESKEAKKNGEKKKGWLFFIGRQDENIPALFHVEDHRLICCIVAEMVYPR